MWKLIAINGEEYTIYNTIKKRFYKVDESKAVSIKDIKDEINKGYSLKIRSYYSTVEGKVLLTVIGMRGNNYIVGTNDMRLMEMSESSLIRVMRTVKCSNVSYTTLNRDTRNEKIKVVGIFGAFQEINSDIAMKYDKFEIMRIRDLYSMVESSHVGESECYGNGNLVTTAFGVKEIKIQGDRDINFLVLYKKIWSKICNDTRFNVYTLYESYSINGCRIEKDGDVLGYYLRWSDKTEVFVLSSDTEMCKLIKIKGTGQFCEDNLKCIKGLYSYGKSTPSSKDSIITSMEKVDMLNNEEIKQIDLALELGLKSVLHIDKKYRLVYNDCKLNMKYRVHMDARDNKCICTKSEGELRYEINRNKKNKVS